MQIKILRQWKSTTHFRWEWSCWTSSQHELFCFYYIEKREKIKKIDLKWTNIWMAKNVVKYLAPLISNLSMKLTDTWIFAFIKDINTNMYTTPPSNRLNAVVLRASYFKALLLMDYLPSERSKIWASWSVYVREDNTTTPAIAPKWDIFQDPVASRAHWELVPPFQRPQMTAWRLTSHP